MQNPAMRETKTSSVFVISCRCVCVKGRDNRVTLGGPLNSWIFNSMSLIQLCISSGESVYRETLPEDKAFRAAYLHLFSH